MSYSHEPLSLGDDSDLLDPPSRISTQHDGRRTSEYELHGIEVAAGNEEKSSGAGDRDRLVSTTVTERTVAPSPSPSSSLADAAILADEEDYIRVVEITNHVFDWQREIAYWVVGVLTGFLSCLLGYWFPRIMRRYRYLSVPRATQAEYVSVQTFDGGCEFIPVEEIQVHSQAYVPHTFGSGWYGPTHLPSRVPADQRMFVFRHHRFFLVEEQERWVKQNEPLQEQAGVLAERLKAGLSSDEHSKRQRLFGINQLQIVVPTYPVLLMQELFHPFLIFQWFSVVLWCFEAYYIFALCIAVIASVSIVTTLLETRSRLLSLSELARHTSEVQCLRTDAQAEGPRVRQIVSYELTAGDVIELTTGDVPCDLVLLSGGAVVNEAMLTGEAIPVIKTTVLMPLDPHAYVPLGIESRSTLYAATKILQLKPSSPGGKVYAMVVRTGFATTKGALILSILYPKPSSFKFVQQSYKFIGSLFVMSLVGFCVSVWQLSVHNAAVQTMIIRGLDLITIVVPPSLPLALSVGVNFALLALKLRKIYCISPSRINLAGKIQFMCFDKTGTLTSEGMELQGVLESKQGPASGVAEFSPFHATLSRTDSVVVAVDIPAARSEGEESGGGLRVQGGRVQRGWSASSRQDELSMPLQDESESLTLSAASSSPIAAPPSPHTALSPSMLTLMSCCHSLAILDGTQIGDPLEIEVFTFTAAILKDGESEEFTTMITVPPAEQDVAEGRKHAVTWGVRTQFEFVPAKQRMSVIATRMLPDGSPSPDEEDTRVFVKGSPEAMKTLCLPHTLPRDFDRRLREYAHRGYRVIAAGWKTLPPEGKQPMEKEALRLLVESELEFAGLIVLENKIKPETAPTLAILKSALIRSVIVSGDNPITCISVSKECGIVEKQAASGGGGGRSGAASGGTKIFLGTLIDQDGGKRIEWIDTAESDNDNVPPLSLNPRTFAIPAGHHPRCRYELAMTGTVFKYLEDRMLAEQAALIARGQTIDYVTNTSTQKDDLSATRYFHRAILNCLVFARMTPTDKGSLVSHLQSLGIYTGMCGDGANDTAALKAGHIGVSLSDSEASIAAPFTSQIPNISCIPVLLSEGRSSLMTSFSLFRYMAMYSMVQFSAVILLYFRGSVLGNWEYLLQDMFIVFPLTVALGGTMATRELSKKRPSGDLLSATNVMNVLAHMLICLGFQLLVFELSASQSDYIDYTSSPTFDNGPLTYESTSIYLYSNFQFIFMAVFFARGAPWKAGLLTNRKFTGWGLLCVVVCLALLFSPDQSSFFRSEEVPIAGAWRGIMFVLVMVDLTVHALFEFLLYPLLLSQYKIWQLQRGKKKVRCYGKVKNAEGPKSKLYHRLRGEFEANWTEEHEFA